jgi:hypothetical protein
MAQTPSRDLEARIRERAYHIWRQEGCPPGRDQVHWDMARELVAIEDNQTLITKPNPQVHDSRRDPVSGEPVEPIEAVTNQGEFPTLTDQGEKQTYPTPRREPSGRRSASR